MSEFIKPPETKNGAPPEGTSDAKMWAMLSHIAPLAGFGIIGPLIVWLVKKEDSPFVDDQAKEALNFQISGLLAAVICGFTLVGILLIPVIGVGSLIYGIIAGMEANKGVAYRYPYNFRFIK
ncbi:MAG: DUF4870 domain-containing protein [bacterium]|nr:DUF4870 domain-containing protein [bacterium]